MLVRAMCDSHPLLTVPPETDFPLALAPVERTPAFDDRRFVDALYADTGFQRWRLPRAAVELSFTARPPANHADAVRRVYGLWAEHRGKRRFVDRNPDNVLHLGAITALFPEARVVHVIRDGRDVAASWLELGWADSIERAALHWRYRVHHGRLAQRLVGERRYHELRYEHLVRDPEATLRKLCAAIEVPFDPAMLDHRRAAAVAVRSEHRPHHHRSATQPLRPGLRDWRRDLPAAAVARFELAAADMLTDLGYELAASKPGVGTRLAVGRRRLSWQIKRGQRRVAP
jgi:sulfotransferase family protein